MNLQVCYYDTYKIIVYNHEVNIKSFLNTHVRVLFFYYTDRLMDVLPSKWCQKCTINFGIKKDIPFQIKYDIPFISVEHDVIVLEADIKEGPDGTPFPTSFRLERDKSQMKEKVHFIGYPRLQDSEHIIDHKCNVIVSDLSKQQTADKFESATKWFEKQSNEDKINFREEYGKLRKILYDLDSCSVLFHCSESNTHGASGSPGIVDLENPVVQVMLLSGCPSFIYEQNPNGTYYKGTKIPPEYLIEKGITMTSIFEIMSCNETLKKELFFNDAV